MAEHSDAEALWLTVPDLSIEAGTISSRTSFGSLPRGMIIYEMVLAMMRLVRQMSKRSVQENAGFCYYGMVWVERTKYHLLCRKS